MTDPSTGYKRPPRRHQFKPGQSGNPKGRPKGARSLESVLAQELQQTVLVRENGRPRTLRKLEVIVRKLVNAGLQGGAKDLELLLRMLVRLPAPDDAPGRIDHLTAAEQAILDRFLGPARSNPAKDAS